MTRSSPLRFSPFRISLGILAAIALALSPQAFAQHAGGGGHSAGGGGAGHFAGGGAAHAGGATAARSAGSGAASHSNQASHSSPIHVFSGPRSAPIAAAPARAAENAARAAIAERDRAAAVRLRSSDISALSSSGVPRGLAAFADPNAPSSVAAAAADRARSDARPPMHITIGFPPSADAGFVSSARSRSSLNFSGQGDHLWQSARSNDAANRNSVRIVGRPPEHVFPKPPHILRRPILSAPVLLSGPAFIFVSPGFGFFGPGFGCNPFWVPSFGCGGFYPCGFGCGGYSYLGFGGAYGGYAGGLDDSAYGYDGGYYAPPSDFGVAPNGMDEGASQEPAPTEWQNPPGENSSPDNSSAENAAAPDTIIYLKDGTSFAVKDYWIADGQLHYVTSYGGENAVDLNQLDLERTTHANKLTLRDAAPSR